MKFRKKNKSPKTSVLGSLHEGGFAQVVILTKLSPFRLRFMG